MREKMLKIATRIKDDARQCGDAQVATALMIVAACIEDELREPDAHEMMMGVTCGFCGVTYPMPHRLDCQA